MKIRKLHERDWESPWWPNLNRNSLPLNGVGGFIIEAQPDRTPIAACWVEIENDVASLLDTISNEDYKDTDKEDAIQLLLKFTKDFVATINYKENTK